MCGIIGIMGEEDAPLFALESLMSIQHRGQDSCGILCYNNNVTLKKGVGLIPEVFSSWKIEKSRLAIGHVRYPTIGTDPSRDAQPFYVNYPYGLGLCHNGNIVNYYELRDELLDKRRRLQSKCDGELLLNIFAEELIDTDVYEAADNVMDRVLGSYSAVSIIADKKGTLTLFRDPWGIRPFVFGKVEPCFAAASESVALDKFGIPSEDVIPGEVITIQGNNIQRKQLRKEHHAHCMFEWVYFSRPDSIIQGSEVYKVRQDIGRILAREHPVEADVAFGVPDSGRAHALGYAREASIEYDEGMMKNRYVGRTFILPDQHNRESDTRAKLNAITSVVRGKRVVMVDDSIVRGTTMRRIVKLLRRAGATEVHVRIGVPHIIAPCPFGIDMKTRDQFLARGRSDEEIARIIGADSVGYLSLKGLEEAIGLPMDSLCVGCLTEEYPLDIPEGHLKDAVC